MNTLYTGAAPRSPAYHPVTPRVRPDGFEPDALRFQQLRRPHEIAKVLDLRREIRLPEATLNDAGFAALEKKETRSDLWVLSSGMAA